MLELKHLLGDALERRRGDAGDDAAGLGRQDQQLLRQLRPPAAREKLASSTSRVGIVAGEPHGAMDRHDGLAGARRTGHARRPREGTLDQRTLGRVEEDAPFLPRKGERLFQFLLVGDQPDPPQRIGMREGIGDGRRRSGRHQPAGGGIFEQRFGGLGRQVSRQREEAVFVGRADVGQPVGGHADGEQRIIVQRGKQRRRGRRLLLALGRLGKDEIERRRRGDFLHALAHLDDLDRAGSRMRLDPPPFGPGIGVVVVADIGDQQAVARLVDDQADVAIDPRRPEIGVLALVDAVQLETVAGRVHLKIEDARLHRLLVQAGQPVERSGEGVGDQEVHCDTRHRSGSERSGERHARRCADLAAVERTIRMPSTDDPAGCRPKQRASLRHSTHRFTKAVFACARVVSSIADMLMEAPLLDLRPMSDARSR